MGQRGRGQSGVRWWTNSDAPRMAGRHGQRLGIRTAGVPCSGALLKSTPRASELVRAKTLARQRLGMSRSRCASRCASSVSTGNTCACHRTAFISAWTSLPDDGVDTLGHHAEGTAAADCPAGVRIRRSGRPRQSGCRRGTGLPVAALTAGTWLAASPAEPARSGDNRPRMADGGPRSSRRGMRSAASVPLLAMTLSACASGEPNSSSSTRTCPALARNHPATGGWFEYPQFPSFSMVRMRSRML